MCDRTLCNNNKTESQSDFLLVTRAHYLLSVCSVTHTKFFFFFIWVSWTRWWPFVGLCKLFSCSPLFIQFWNCANDYVTWLDSITFEMNYNVLLQIFIQFRHHYLFGKIQKLRHFMLGQKVWAWLGIIIIIFSSTLWYLYYNTHTLNLCTCNRNPPQGKELYTLHNSHSQAIKKRYIYSLGAHMG